MNSPIRTLSPINSRRESWSKLGTNFSDNPTFEEAFVAAEMNYGVEKRPLYQLVDGQFLPVEKHVALAKVGSSTIFDVVTSRYEAIDNMAIARAMEPLRAWGKVVAAGYLGDGEAMFAVLSGPHFDIQIRNKGDMMRFDAICYEDKRTGNALWLELLPYRLVCLNGLIRPAFGDAISAPISHTDGINSIVRWVGASMANMGKLQLDITKNLQALADTNVSDEEVEHIISSAFPLPVPTKSIQRLEALIESSEYTVDAEFIQPTEDNIAVRDMLAKKTEKFEYDLDRAKMFRNLTWETYQGEIVDQGAAGTAYGAYNAVTAVADHQNVTMKAARASIFGDMARAKVAAFKAASKIAKINFSKN